MKRLLRLILSIAGIGMALFPTAQADPPSGGKAGTASPPTSPLSTRLSSPTRTGETRYGWNWLAARYDKDGNGTVIREEFPASADIFARLDRNWDGRLMSDDFDWSENGTLGRQKETTFALFKSVDKSSDGRITPEEWQAVFAKAAEANGYLTNEDLEQLIYLPHVLKAQKEQQSRAGRMERRIENGEPIVEAPKPGEIAPDFELHSPDGLTNVRLSSFRGNKPVVLIFGSFT